MNKSWDNLTGKGVRIVVIDSGVDQTHRVFQNIDIDGFSIKRKGNSFVVQQEIKDLIGHGTAVTYLLKNTAKDCQVICLNIMQENIVDEDVLIYALEYVYQNIPCNIINISCGVCYSEKLPILENVCKQLSDKGIIIVAAFDNFGRISYPAFFDCVIGIDSTMSLSKPSDYQFIVSNSINIRGSLYKQRVPALNQSWKYDGGSSLITPFITGQIAKMMEVGINDKKDILEELERNAKTVITPKVKWVTKECPSIHKAIIYPVNKEVIPLAHYAEELCFEIESFYDTKYSRKIGKPVSNSCNKSGKEFIIKDIETIDWTKDFDTVIIGNTSKTDLILGRNYHDEIIQKCIIYNKNIYSFEEVKQLDSTLGSIKSHLFCPAVYEEDVGNDLWGKLFCIGKPTLLIAGTSPKQGKFHLQMELRKRFIINGYSIGQLGTEPGSLLFGFDQVYNMGFNSSVHISGPTAVTYVNYLMHEIEKKNPDLIIAGSQSQTVQTAEGNSGFYPIGQYEFLVGVQADACILCVTIFDDEEYIRRTLEFIHGINGCHTIALMVFPVLYENLYGTLIGQSREVADKELQDYRNKLRDSFGIEVYIAKDPTCYDKIYNMVISYFGEG